MEIHSVKEDICHKLIIFREGEQGPVQDFSRFHEEKMQLGEEAKVDYTDSRNNSNKQQQLCFTYLL